MFIKVKLHPKSKKQKLEKRSDEKYDIWVKSKAEQNKANNEMIELLAEELKIKKNQIKFYSGHHHPIKMLEVIN